MDPTILRNIDSPPKAYLLGWIASNTTTLDTDKIIINADKQVHQLLGQLIGVEEDVEGISLQINSATVAHDAKTHLHIGDTKHVDICMPNLPPQLLWAFIRGFFEGNGGISNCNVSKRPEMYIMSWSHDMISSLIKVFKPIPCIATQQRITFTDTNAVDAIGKMYMNCGNLKMQKMYDQYQDMLQWCPVVPRRSLPVCQVFKAHPGAVLPTKAKASDVGYDLTVISEAKKWHKNITLYDTGIKVKVQHGYYAEVVPRSSLSKSGYMLANSIGIIDPSYTGNIYIALAKIDPTAPDIELPFRCCQLIFRRQVHVELDESAVDFEATARADGGFGSTGK